jgi:hypothetical protein
MGSPVLGPSSNATACAMASRVETMPGRGAVRSRYADGGSEGKHTGLAPRAHGSRREARRAWSQVPSGTTSVTEASAASAQWEGPSGTAPSAGNRRSRRPSSGTDGATSGRPRTTTREPSRSSVAKSPVLLLLRSSMWCTRSTTLMRVGARATSAHMHSAGGNRQRKQRGMIRLRIRAERWSAELSRCRRPCRLRRPRQP